MPDGLSISCSALRTFVILCATPYARVTCSTGNHQVAHQVRPPSHPDPLHRCKNNDSLTFAEQPLAASRQATGTVASAPRRTNTPKLGQDGGEDELNTWGAGCDDSEHLARTPGILRIVHLIEANFKG